jgi:PAS domain S-box-containing protein
METTMTCIDIGQNQYWKTIIDTMAEALMVVDTQGLIISVNQSMLELTGYSELDLVGKTCGVLNCNNCLVNRERRSGHFCVLFKNKRLKMKCSMQKKDGTYVSVFKNATVFRNGDGEIIGGVETLTDLSEVLAQQKIISCLRQELNEKDHFQSLIGKSKAMQRVFQLITSVAESEVPVIIYGESGTGKELVANAIHNLSPRAKQPFVKVNCAALNESLLETELFGHVKGAFTGAVKTRIGRFEAAQKGDIFLDEIGDMPLSSQVKILRVLEQKVIEKVGDNQSVAVDVRVISATNKNMDELIQSGAFREDLFYRIGVIPIHIPPLRERKDDLPLLINAFLQRIALKTGKQVTAVSKPALDILYDYGWPGNIRELINVMEHAFILCREGEIGPEHLPDNLLHSRKIVRTVPVSSPVKDNDLEKRELIEAITSTGGNKVAAAKKLGISRVALYNRLRKHHLQVERRICQ